MSERRVNVESNSYRQLHLLLVANVVDLTNLNKYICVIAFTIEYFRQYKPVSMGVSLLSRSSSDSSPFVPVGVDSLWTAVGEIKGSASGFNDEHIVLDVGSTFGSDKTSSGDVF